MTFAGSWAQDQRDGQGTYAYPNSDTFGGGWSAGQKHGKGTYFFKESMSQVRGVHFLRAGVGKRFRSCQAEVTFQRLKRVACGLGIAAGRKEVTRIGRLKQLCIRFTVAREPRRSIKTGRVMSESLFAVPIEISGDLDQRTRDMIKH